MSKNNSNGHEKLKKEHEKRVLETFLKKIQMNYSGMEAKHPPNPDFKIIQQIGSRQKYIGIELTVYPNKEAIENERRFIDIVEDAKKEYEKSGGKKSAYFILAHHAKDLILENKQEKENFINHLNCFIINNEGEHNLNCHAFLSWIDIYERPHLKWEYVEAVFTNTDWEFIHERIKTKNEKIGNYCDSFDEKWLLIYSSSRPIGLDNEKTKNNFNAMSFKLTGSEKTIDIMSAFDKVFIQDFTCDVYKYRLDGHKYLLYGKNNN